MAEKILKKFVINLGENHKDLISGLKSADDTVTSFVLKARNTLAGLGVGVGLTGLIKSFADFGNDLGMFSQSTGIAVEDISRLGGALEYFGGNVDSAKSALQNLQDATRQAVDWGTGPLLDVARKYGIAIQDQFGQVKDAVGLYTSLADEFQRLSKAQQNDLASTLGLDSSSILLLQQGKVAVQDMMDAQIGLAGITEADAKMSRDWVMSVTKLKQTFTALGRELARILLPTVQKITKFMSDLADKFRKNDALIKRIGEVIKNNLVPAFAFAAVNIGRSLAPLMRSLLPLTAVALLIDDIAVFMADNGGKSIIGTLLGDRGDGVREKLKSLFSGLNGILGKVFIGDFRGAFDEFKKLWKGDIVPLASEFGSLLLGSIKKYFPPMVAEFVAMLPQITDSLINILWSALTNIMGGLVDIINGISKGLGFGPLFKNKDGSEFSGNDAVEGLNYMARDGNDPIDKFISGIAFRFFGGGSTDKLDKEAAKYGIKPRDPISSSGAGVVNSSLNNKNITINQNYQTTINSTGSLSADAVKNGVTAAGEQTGRDLTSALAFTGGN